MSPQAPQYGGCGLGWCMYMYVEEGGIEVAVGICVAVVLWLI